MKHLNYCGLLLACLLMMACSGGGFGSNQPAASPPPASTAGSSDVMRAGDKITIRLTGVPDGEYLIEVQIPSSGDVTVPLLTRSFKAIGRSTSDLANEISQAYKTDKIYTNPQLTVLPEERFVSLGGEVRSPTRVAYTPDLTLLTAINSCGGFTEYADRRHVRMVRGQQVFYVDCVKAATTPGADPALYPGDQITVPRTIF